VTTRTVVIVTIACLFFFVIGMVLDWEGFVGNLAVGAIEVILTVTIIDWLLKRQRREQWRKVRTQIVSALAQHIDNMGDEYQASFHGPGLNLMDFGMEKGPYGVPNPQTAKALQSMIRNMEEALRPDDSREQAEKLHSAIEWDTEQILNTLLPRILAIECDEPELASVLGEFDNAVRQWRNEIKVDEEISLGCDQYSTAIQTLKAVTQVYEYLVNHSGA
jgi:hypothetical protein